MFSTIDKAMFLKKVEIFSSVRTEDILQIAAISEEVCFTAGQTIFAQGEVADSLYFVTEGRVELRTGGQGAAVVVDGGSFGSYALLTASPRHFTAVAASDTCALRIPSVEFMDMLADNPRIAIGMLRDLALLAAADLRAASSGALPRDDDDRAVPEPAVDEAGDFIWSDGAYFMSVYQMEKPLDLGWLLQKARLLPREEAENVDGLDEVPNSAWFTNRHGRRRMSREELARGPGGPASGPGAGRPGAGRWTVIKGKALGQNPGFTAKDEEGRLLFVKFDPPGYPGLNANADVIASRLLHAAGYNVPEYHAVWIATQSLVLGAQAAIPGKYRVKRPMTWQDLDGILAAAPRDPQGRVLADVSVGLAGKPKGPFSYLGVRKDDPDDTVRHENRRELRGLRVLMAWINNVDARRGNTLDMYVEEGGRRLLRHYQLDLSASFGSGNISPKEPEEGHEYFFDPAVVAKSFGALGAWLKPWERAGPVPYPEIGRFDSGTFEPEAWRTSYANPAFEKMTPRDAFWAAKIVTAFTDDDIRALAGAGAFLTPGAEESLSRVLIERRDKIGRRWLEAKGVSPLDPLEVVPRGDGGFELAFRDLALERGYADRAATRYRLRYVGGASEPAEVTRVPLPDPAAFPAVELETSRDSGKSWGRPLAVELSREGGGWRVSRLRR